ncbi:glycosyltransferase involved in cell wall biosynthesis [Chromohalobacter marismortui]|uniref:Glycosyltransferase involved in cell wall biosynthesis n=1 Tax=Chromohalobacter marismortui TaxID=42055 RepID=A0A4R7NM52_9GAMM|nr:MULTISPECIES: glycosyltransferase family 2 protein [Chromohalobacter]MCI0510234.1 glycosyltransferase family 2 protein [Chromohalobacter sp.]MCI0593410.1 glycosyltransferase family 2 protein [Chromohalobacter sp.]TDU21652.1 glycosyltransferase involved in cell wall biosynthesis [Chromohalobacter marismortui]
MRDEARPCVIVPVYNHADAVGRTCQALRRLGVPLLLIDDGCEPACVTVLRRLADAPDTHLLTLACNQGKGAAVRAGLREAQRLGFTHALQVDADGQHDADDLPPFLADLHADDMTLRIGYPRFDASVPRHRFYARYLTHSLVWLNTLSFALRDTMCGVKLYPVAAVNHLVARHPCGNRMQFDTELPVRWAWEGHRVENLPVRVVYPLDGISHFAMWRDNRQLTAMHLRLFAGMLWRLPRLLRRNARMTRSNE